MTFGEFVELNGAVYISDDQILLPGQLRGTDMFVVNAVFLEQNPGVIAGFLLGIKDSMSWIQAHPEEAVQFAEDHRLIPSGLSTNIISGFGQYERPSEITFTAVVDWMIATNLKLRENILTYDQYVDLRFLK